MPREDATTTPPELTEVLRELQEIKRRLPKTGAGFDAWGDTVAFSKRHDAIHKARREAFLNGEVMEGAREATPSQD